MARAASGLWWILGGVLALAPAAWAAPGDLEWIGGQPFRALDPAPAPPEQPGRAAAAEAPQGPQGRRFVYEHMDGVGELFQEPAWEGSLGSRFDPQRGRFERRFNAAELMNELLGGKTSSASRRRAARLLALYAALHPVPGGPSSLEPARPRIARHLDAEGQAWVEAEAARLRPLLARPRPSPAAPPRAPLRTSEDHYRALLADGFLDVVVVAGNSLDHDTGERSSGRLLQAFRRELAGIGLRPQAERGVEGALWEGRATIVGRPARVRVRVAGGSGQPDEVRRAVAAFVEGLARADVVIFVGHSNKESGAYYLSEAKSAYSRFRLGKDAPDLAARCHSLGRAAHQVLVLQSCSSYPKYCQPMRARYTEAPDRTPPGFLGTPSPAYFEDFIPRTTALLRHLIEGQGPRRITATLNALRPRPKTPLLLLRGVLQPPRGWVVPPGVRIVRERELGDEEGYLCLGEGSDGASYVSTAAFPQDRPGDVVQVLRWGKGAFARYRDGALAWVGPDTGGAAVEPQGTRHLRARYLTCATIEGRAQLLLLDERGRVVLLAGDGSQVRVARAQPPAPLSALGETGGRLSGLDEGGRGWQWTGGGWQPLEAPPTLEAPLALEGPGPRGELRLALEPKR
ncbi:MAG: hypothetical protein AB7N76_20295 [Planctomycetota bacterium]